MSVIVFLIAAGGVVATAFLAGFVWAVRSGQFDDTLSPPVRMLLDDPAPRGKASASRGTAHVQSRP
jgi:cbb3-type cytochrome oxidase maturation protein